LVSAGPACSEAQAMKRQKFSVALLRGVEFIAEDTAYAHNSGVRKSEALAREYARAHGIILHGGKPHRDDSGYIRFWRSDDGQHEVTASVVPV
jgi:hypothetical protein